MFFSTLNKHTSAVADLHSKILDTPPVQILSISCSFWENLAKSYVGATPPPPPGELASPPQGNPGSATALIESGLNICL